MCISHALVALYDALVIQGAFKHYYFILMHYHKINGLSVKKYQFCCDFSVNQVSVNTC